MRDPDRFRDEPPINGQARWLVGIATGVSLLTAVWVSKAEAGGVVPYAIYAGLMPTPLLAPGCQDVHQGVPARRATHTAARSLRDSLRFVLLLARCGTAVAGLARRLWATAGSRGLLMTSGALVGIIAAVAWGAAIYQTALRPADAYRVTFESASAAKTAAGTGSAASDAGDRSRCDRRQSEGQRLGRVLRIHLTTDQRADLEKRLWRLPGVSRVGLCSRWRGEC